VWPVAAVVLGALPAVVSAVVLRGPAAIPPHVAAVAASVGGPLGVVGYTLLAGPLTEEFGWRGFLQPRLRERYRRIRTTDVLAVAWGLWHVPLFLLPGSTALLPEYGDTGPWWQTGVALGIAVVLAVLWRTARPRRSPMACGAGCPQAGFST
jgi:membrane protease YdiL (CAAX protease family)